ncbi:hypothetical protein BH11MYX3_BH11MYX3_21350 [soil metagenome]
MRLLVIVVIAGTGCGRLGFDALADDAGSDIPTDATGAVDGDDAPPALSCGTLAPTCGPTGTSSCCESPVVTGGTFYRSFDVSGDGMYLDPSFPATVSTFRLDKYEVTVGRFRRFVGAGGTQASPPPAGAGARALDGMTDQGGWDPSWNGNLTTDTASLIAAINCDVAYQTWTDTPGANESRPMNCLTWYEAMAFCVWDGGYLPTEAESMYAASGGDLQRAYPWSNPPSSVAVDDTLASYSDVTKGCFGDGIEGCALTDLVRVGSKPGGDGRWGQSDLGGNVWEWVLDGYAGLDADPCTDCANVTATASRVVRGGSFGSDATYLRAASRDDLAPMIRADNRGVRCARALIAGSSRGHAPRPP